jgi:hypothetical protein
MWVFRNSRKNDVLPPILSSRIRILYMPPVYGVISFLSYRFFRDYTYYSFIEVGEYSFYELTSTRLELLYSLWGQWPCISPMKAPLISIVQAVTLSAFLCVEQLFARHHLISSDIFCHVDFFSLNSLRRKLVRTTCLRQKRRENCFFQRV